MSDMQVDPKTRKAVACEPVKARKTKKVGRFGESAVPKEAMRNMKVLAVYTWPNS